jgi:predicted RND superfamily exporter protein
MGIEVKNSILLVDFTNQLREEGLGIDEAVQKAGEIRFVPILLTTLTAIGGLVPLALERSPLYSPLAWVILGGLVSSTLLARVVTPVLYKLLPPAIEKSGQVGRGARRSPRRVSRTERPRFAGSCGCDTVAAWTSSAGSRTCSACRSGCPTTW